MSSADPIPETADGDLPEAAPQRILVGASPRQTGSLRLKLRHSRAGDLWRLLRWSTADFLVWSKRARRHARADLAERSRERIRFLAATSPARAAALARQGRRLLPRSLFFAQAEALLTARRHGWTAAAPQFAAIAAAAAGPRPLAGPAAEPVLRSGQPSPALALALPARDRPVWLPPEVAARIVVYTVLVGAGRPLPPRFTFLHGVRFLCFTDQALAAEGWEIVPVTAGDPDRGDAWHKIRAHAALAEIAPEAECSLFVAPDMLMIGNLDTLLTRWLLPHDLVLWRHADCIDWHDLAERHLVEDAPDPVATADLLAQAATCEAAGLPRDAGACDSRVLWRRHGQPEVITLMEAWWRTFVATPGADDLALYRVLQDRGAPPPAAPLVLPASLGSAWTNLFFARAPEGLWDRPATPRPPRRGRMPVGFLAVPGDQSSVTVLRGEQLCAMVAARYPDRYDMTYTDDAATLRDQVVVLSKNALRLLTPAEIAAIRARNVAVIACWDDDPADPDKADRVDAQMAVSIGMMLELSRQYPDRPAYLVTHHVNPQIPRVTPPTDRLRTGYFGTPHNTILPAALGSMVDLIGIDPYNPETSWMAAMHRYNAHWIVRRRQSFDGWKPFLKGFIAARCKSIAIVARDDGDAAHYLGDDYPFYVRSLAPGQLEEDMLAFSNAFGGPEWRMGLEIMAQVAERCSVERVCADFAAMIEDVTR